GSFQATALATGAYAGFLGAGIGIILVALLRLKHPAVERIAHVKIQARCIEWLIGFVAVIAHYFHGNLILALWLARGVARQPRAGSRAAFSWRSWARCRGRSRRACSVLRISSRSPEPCCHS